MTLSNQRNSLRRKLYMILSLNIADWICTIVLLNSGRFYEMNPLARLFIRGISAGYLIKCILPAALITLITRLIGQLDTEQLRRIDRFAAFALVFYILLDANHIVNFAILFFHAGG